MGVNIRDILELQLDYVKIKNVNSLEQKINKMIEDGKNNLQVIADFDCTLTKQRCDKGNKLLSSFGMFSECPSVPESYRLNDKKLCDYYKPIENDPSLSIDEKTQHMEEWYRQANDLLKDFQYPVEELNEISLHVVKNLRDGVETMFNKLKSNDVPVLVFSAGLGDAVECVLKNANIFTPNVKVISNFLNIDEKGCINGLKGKIIHVFNKNETVIKGTQYYNVIKSRGNVILLGDSLGDARMADGMDHSEAVIKIAFLFHNIEGNLPLYLDHFDIVIVDDQTVDIPKVIFDLVLQ